MVSGTTKGAPLATLAHVMLVSSVDASASNSRGGPFKNAPCQTTEPQSPSPQLLTCSFNVSDSKKNNGNMCVMETDGPGNGPVTLPPLPGGETPTMVRPLAVRVNEPTGMRPRFVILAVTVNGGRSRRRRRDGHVETVFLPPVRVEAAGDAGDRTGRERERHQDKTQVM